MLMNVQPLYLSISFLLTTGTAFSSVAHSATQKVAQGLTQNSNTVTNASIQVLFKPSGGGKPPTTRGAGSRNDRLCPQDIALNPDALSSKPQPLTALVPSNQLGLTWAERPTIWVYLPKTSARQIVLSIKAAGSQHSQRFLPITGAAGIVGIPVAETAPPLEVGKSYQWAVVLICGDRPSPNDPFVTAWVQRVLPDTVWSDRQSALERAARYGERGIWYDALTTLAAVRRSQPNNAAFTKIWTNFLAQPSVGLGAISEAPLR